MNKKLLLSVFIIVFFIIYCRGENRVSMEEYEKILYRLGSYPVLKIDKKYWNADDDPRIFLKGERIDINGWIIPYWLHSGSFLSDKEKEIYGITEKHYLDYKEYISYLQKGNYKKPVNPLFFAVINFVLDDFLYSGMKIKDINPFLAIYEADIGLENKVFMILKGNVTPDQIIKIYNIYHDEKLIALFPASKVQDYEKYISFLEKVLVDVKDYYRKFQIHYILFSLDKANYRETMENYIIENLSRIEQPNQRLQLCSALMDINDEQSLHFLEKELLTEKSRLCIEQIIQELTRRRIITPGLVNTALELCTRNEEQYNDKILGRMPDGFRYYLKQYLRLALDDKNTEEGIKEKIKKILAL